VDRKGAQYVIPVQAKGTKDRVAAIQIEQDMALCAARFPSLICKPVAAQFMSGGVIAMFEFQEGDEGVGVVAERHYRLVPPEELSEDELRRYNLRGSD
jgi:hypothetical protein